MRLENPWNVYRTRFLVRARQLTEPLVFTDLLGRDHSGQPGDYLVETSDGIRRITTRTLFEDIYVPLAIEETSRPVERVQKRSASEVRVRPSAGDDARATARWI